MLARLGRLLCVGLVAWAWGCEEPAQAPPAEVVLPPALHFFEMDGAISVSRDGGAKQVLADDGRGYAVHASKDGRWIALDVSLFSTLQTTRLMRWDAETGAYVDSINVSRVAWEQLVEAKAIRLEAVENPRSRFVSWSEDGSALVVELTGHDPGGAEIRQSLTIALK